MDEFDIPEMTEPIQKDHTWIPVENTLIEIEDCTSEQFQKWCTIIYPPLQFEDFSNPETRRAAFSLILQTHFYLLNGRRQISRNN